LKIRQSFEQFAFRVYRFFQMLPKLFLDRSPARLVLVSGPAHSGTTILAQTVGNLPDCQLINFETGFFLDPPGGIRILPYLLASRKKWVVEKTPMHLHRIKRILTLVPDSKHLIVYRDPRDTVASVLMRLEGDFHAAMKATRDSFEEILNVRNIEQVKLISYEELVLKREETLVGISKWLGVEMDFGVLDVSNHSIFFGEGSGRNTPGFGTTDHVLRRRWQVRQPFFDGRGRYEHILSPQQLKLIDVEFRSIMNVLRPD